MRKLEGFNGKSLVRDIKQRIEEADGVPPRFQNLNLGKIPLKDEENMFFEYGIKKGSLVDFAIGKRNLEKF